MQGVKEDDAIHLVAMPQGANPNSTPQSQQQQAPPPQQQQQQPRVMMSTITLPDNGSGMPDLNAVSQTIFNLLACFQCFDLHGCAHNTATTCNAKQYCSTNNNTSNN